MSKTSDYKKFLRSLLSEYCPSAYFGQCNSGIFPRLEYELKELSVDEETYEKHILTLNFYDRNTFEIIDEISDRLIAETGRAEFYTEDYYFKFIYGKDRQSIPDSDKSIRCLRMTFEVRIFSRSDK